MTRQIETTTSKQESKEGIGNRQPATAPPPPARPIRKANEPRDGDGAANDNGKQTNRHDSPQTNRDTNPHLPANRAEGHHKASRQGENRGEEGREKGKENEGAPSREPSLIISSRRPITRQAAPDHAPSPSNPISSEPNGTTSPERQASRDERPRGKDEAERARIRRHTISPRFPRSRMRR